MDKLGVVLHISGSRKIVLRTKIKVRTGIDVVNEELKSIGKIFDVFGPIRNPYVTIEPKIDDPQRYVGHSVYIMEKKVKDRNGRSRRKSNTSYDFKTEMS